MQAEHFEHMRIENIKQKFQMAKRKYENNEFSETIRICDTILAGQKDDVDVLLLKGAALRKQGRYENALACFKTALRYAPNDSVILSQIAYTSDCLGDTDEAINRYKEVLKILENDSSLKKAAETANNLGYLYQKLENYKNALFYYKKATLLHSSEKLYRDNLNDLLNLLGEDNVLTLLHKGREHKNQKKYQEALAFFVKALNFEPTSLDILFEIADTHECLHDLPQARITYEKILEINSNSDRAMNCLGKIHMNTNYRSHDTLNYFKEAFKISPDNESYARNIISALRLLDQTGEIFSFCIEQLKAEKHKPLIIETLSDLSSSFSLLKSKYSTLEEELDSEKKKVIALESRPRSPSQHAFFNQKEEPESKEKTDPPSTTEPSITLPPQTNK
jgi:tetratricopeptide (TPR) repeat protein